MAQNTTAQELNQELNTEHELNTGLELNTGPESNIKEKNPHQVARAERENFLNRLLQEEPVLTPEQETQAALAEMKHDVMAHLTRAVLRCFIAGDAERVADVVLPHLSGCSWCCITLQEALRLGAVPKDCPAYAILEEANEWKPWAAGGETAGASACAVLTQQGIGYVYGRDGNVYRRLPNGEEEQISNGTEASSEAEPTAR